MASRLALKYGLVSEEDRLSNSADAIVVTEPTTGSKARTKGSLYLIVCTKQTGGRTRDACRLVADTIRREYYYDESAGISIVLEKAVRAANRRLRQSREGGGLAAYSIGITLAVVRGSELYVATAGDANAYLIRSARLLMPEHHSGVGLPAADNLRLGVWRGDFAVGDSLVLCSRNLVEVVGTEELKNAVVTLHPQSAVEHLHHLFVAAAGEGSDAVIALEATEVSLSRVEHRLVPVSPAEPLAGAPEHSPIPLADQVSALGTAVRDRAGAARTGIGNGISGTVGRILDLMPRRRAGYRRMRTAAESNESRRRSSIAAIALVAVIVVLGALVLYLNPFRTESPDNNTPDAAAALADAITNANQVFGPTDLLHTDPTSALPLLQTAWDDLDGARGGVDATSWNRVEAQVANGLDTLFNTTAVSGTRFYSAPAGELITDLVIGPDSAAYAIVGTGVVRVDPTNGSVATIVQTGSGTAQGMAQPRLLGQGGPDLLIVDTSGGLWRWRPSDAQGGGTLGQVRVAGDQVWGADVVDIETFVINADQGSYRIYVPYPAQQQILRYEPTADGSGFSAPAPYFVGTTENVSAFKQLMIDGDVYAVTEPTLTRYFTGRDSGFSLDPAPDDKNLRPGHLYEMLAATGTKGDGDLFLWDKQWSRILVYDKVEGTYLQQYIAANGAPPLSDLTGMYIVDRGVTQPPILVWARPDGLYQVPLVPPQTPIGSPAPSGVPPSGLPTSAPTLPPASFIATPPPTVTPVPASIEPTIRPRRTPEGAPATPIATP